MGLHGPARHTLRLLTGLSQFNSLGRYPHAATVPSQAHTHYAALPRGLSTPHRLQAGSAAHTGTAHPGVGLLALRFTGYNLLRNDAASCTCVPVYGWMDVCCQATPRYVLPVWFATPRDTTHTRRWMRLPDTFCADAHRQHTLHPLLKTPPPSVRARG